MELKVVLERLGNEVRLDRLSLEEMESTPCLGDYLEVWLCKERIEVREQIISSLKKITKE